MSALGDIVRRFFNQTNAGGSAWLQNSAYLSDTISKAEQLKTYRGYVYACVSAIAEEVGRIEFFVYTKLDDGTIKKNPQHPLLKVLNAPHPDWSAFEFFEMMQTLGELTGDMFIYLELGEQTRQPKGMDLIRPDRVSIAIDEQTGLITGYLVDLGQGGRLPLEKDEVIHIKFPNPENFYVGLGTPAASLDYIQTEAVAAKYTKTSLANNGSPSGIVTFNNIINSEDFEEAKQKWKSEFTGSKNAGKTLFLRKADVTYTKLGATLGELAMTELRKMGKEDVMAMFRVPKSMLGIVEDVNFNNGQNAKRSFLENVIEPKMFRIIDGLQPLMDRYPNQKNELLGFVSPVPEDEAAKVKLYESGLNKWLTVNDIRKREGLDPMDGGDVIYQPINLMPIGEEPAAPQEVPQEKSAPIRLLKVKKKIKQKELTYEVKEAFRASLEKNQNQYTALAWKKTKKLLNQQKKEVMGNVTKMVTKDYGGVLFNEAEWVQRFNGTYIPLMYTLSEEQGAVAMEFAGNDVGFELDDKLKKRLSTHVDKMSTTFNEETLNSLRSTLEEGVLAGEGNDDLARRIGKVYRQAAGYRAERIARSESSFASNTSTLDAYQQNPYVIAKEWFANPGACEFCMALHGQTISLEEPYALDGTSVNGESGASYSVSYGDVGNPPLHPNCTCTILPVRRQA